MLIDDLGFFDSSIRKDNLSHTPNMHGLAQEGIMLDCHHTYLWCSPTRRSFLTGRYPVHVTGTQAPTCSNLTPLQFSLLSEKLDAVGYESHFIGKGHLGYQTTDHLPVNRGFTSHVGFLGGGESYAHGRSPRCQDDGKNDMWLNDGPAVNLVGGDYYSTNFFTEQAVDRIRARNRSRPFWLHLTYQAVHTGAARLPPSWERWSGDVGLAQSLEYRSAMHVLDVGVGNITAALKEEGMWDNTLFLFTADNGGDCGLLGGDANNYPLLGRKCTAFDGGTRAVAFVTGGLVPPALRGTVNDKLYHVTDWYPTFSALAGVDATDDWVDPATNLTHGIDGVNIWPSLVGDAAAPRGWLPTTERSIHWDDGEGHMWKLITDEKKSNRFHPNGSQYMDQALPCLNASQGGDTGYTPEYDAVGVPPSCTVCSATTPCLFDVRADPSEFRNLAPSMPDLVAKMAGRLATYTPYVPALTPGNLNCYTCAPASGPTGRPQMWWQGFSGPCCKPDAAALAAAQAEAK